MLNNKKVVLVTGASRGLGRGIARQFGQLGATVYVTGRNAGTLIDTVADVEQAGGCALAVAVDHRDDAQVAALIKRIESESGRLDIVVNNAAAVHRELAQPGPFWEKPLHLSEMLDVGLRTNYTMSYFAAPLLLQTPGSLIVNISFYGSTTYFHGPAYGAAKAGTDKMSFDMALDLRPHGVACVSLWPGFIFTDQLAQFVKSVPADAIPAYLAELLPSFERPEFSALVIDALHNDSDMMSYSGQTLIGAEMGLRYSVKDIDDKQPLSYRDSMGNPLVFVMPHPGQPMSGH